MQRRFVLSFILVFSLGFPSSLWAQKPVSLKFGDPLPANAFVELARVVNPAVVNISTSILPKRMGRPYRDPFLDMLEQFYGYRMQPQQIRPQTSLGTGFVIREDGLILTNNHVIAGADKIQVQFEEKNGKFYDAKVIGSDDRTDIALIKIEGKGFPTVQLGSSKDLEVGEWVAAFGNPFGNGHTMTKGIISAKGRDIGEINKFPLLQTDAPINPGNSGGPLVNMKGLVIGVNSAIDARAQGIGFAIPIDEVKNILPQLEKSGHIRKGYLGVGLADLDPQAAMALGLEDLEGAVIAQVEPGGPAAKGGMQPYDVVTEFNGRKIHNSSELRDAVADADIGGDAKVKVVREGKKKTLTVKVAERPDLAKVKPPKTVQKSLGLQAPYDFGFAVTDANPDVRKEFNIDEDVNRPIVTDVLPGTVAARAGLLPGDIILDVNRKEVSSAQDVLKNLKKGSNTLRVARQGAVLFLVLKGE
jgi:serine protease Do